MGRNRGPALHTFFEIDIDAPRRRSSCAAREAPPRGPGGVRRYRCSVRGEIVWSGGRGERAPGAGILRAGRPFAAPRARTRYAGTGSGTGGALFGPRGPLFGPRGPLLGPRERCSVRETEQWSPGTTCAAAEPNNAPRGRCSVPWEPAAGQGSVVRDRGAVSAAGRRVHGSGGGRFSGPWGRHWYRGPDVGTAEQRMVPGTRGWGPRTRGWYRGGDVRDRGACLGTEVARSRAGESRLLRGHEVRARADFRGTAGLEPQLDLLPRGIARGGPCQR